MGMSAEANERDLEEAARLFKVLGSATRLQLLVLVDSEPTTVGALADRAGIPQPLVSQHLRTLRQTGLVTVTKAGRERIYEVVDHHVTHVVRDALEHVREPAPAQGQHQHQEES